MGRGHIVLRQGKDVISCRACGAQIRFMDVGEKRPKPFGMDNMPHNCPGPKVKVYSEEEKKEFERKRLAGEV